MDKRIKSSSGWMLKRTARASVHVNKSRQLARFVGTVCPGVRRFPRALAKAREPSAVGVVYEGGPTGRGLCR